MVYDGPPGMIDTIYRGGKGDFLEGGVRVPAMAWWPGVIAPGQLVGDIIHATDLFTTFARLGGATDNIPTDRIIDGIDQTALFLKGDTFGRRDYVFIYTGNILAATVKGPLGRRKARPVRGCLLRSLHRCARRERQAGSDALGQGNVRYDESPARAVDAEVSEHARGSRFPVRRPGEPAPGNQGCQPAARDPSKLPFDPAEAVKQVPGWAGAAFDSAD